MKNRGFTLLEVFIVLAIIGVIGVLIASAFMRPRLNPQEQAKQWAKELHLDVQGITCTSTDSNNDGYVSCTISSSTGLVPVECATGWSMNEGCRIPKLQ